MGQGVPLCLWGNVVAKGSFFKKGGGTFFVCLQQCVDVCILALSSARLPGITWPHSVRLKHSLSLPLHLLFKHCPFLLLFWIEPGYHISRRKISCPSPQKREAVLSKQETHTQKMICICIVEKTVTRRPVYPLKVLSSCELLRVILYPFLLFFILKTEFGPNSPSDRRFHQTIDGPL